MRLHASGTPGAPPMPSRAFTVVGVVRDVNGPLAPDMFPSRSVYVPTVPEAPGTSLTLRVRGDPGQARQVLLDDLTRVDPGLGEITTMRTIAGMQTYVLRIAFWVAVVLGGLALVLTVSGLFSVLSYIVEQRAKDLGVHMALGATGGCRGSCALRVAASGWYRSRRRRRPGGGGRDSSDGGDGLGSRNPHPCLRSRLTRRPCWSSSYRAWWPCQHLRYARPESIQSRRSGRIEICVA